MMHLADPPTTLPEWLATEDSLPVEGDKALVFALHYLGETVIYRTAECLGGAMADLEGMDPDDQATITVKAMTRAELEGLKEFEGF